MNRLSDSMRPLLFLPLLMLGPLPSCNRVDANAIKGEAWIAQGDEKLHTQQFALPSDKEHHLAIFRNLVAELLVRDDFTDATPIVGVFMETPIQSVAKPPRNLPSNAKMEIKSIAGSYVFMQLEQSEDGSVVFKCGGKQDDMQQQVTAMDGNVSFLIQRVIEHLEEMYGDLLVARDVANAG